MNGLEAIKAMLEGKVVTDGKYLYKEIDGDICFQGEDVYEYTCDNEFNFASDYEEYIEPKPLTGWERVNEGAETYFISVYQGVDSEFDWHDEIDTRCFDEANYFSTKEKAEEINFKQTLFRKLQRFSDENGGNEIDWSNFEEPKFRIGYSLADKYLTTIHVYTIKSQGCVYFTSGKIAKKAIELFYDDLIKYFTGDFGGESNE